MVEVTEQRGGAPDLRRKRWIDLQGIRSSIMKFWPFGNKLETRQDTSYTDTLVGLLVARAQGKSLAVPSATAALEACAGLTWAGALPLRKSRARTLSPGH